VNPRHRPSILTTILVAFPAAAGALVASAASAEPIEVPTVTIYANQAPTEVAKSGASVTIVSGEQLRAQGVSSVGDALRAVPGVAVTQSGGRGALTEVRIRGGETNQALIIIDGIEVNGLADGFTDLADLAVDDIERIEVIRGPQSGVHGSYAQTGVIAITTLSGKGLDKPRISAKIEGGSFGTRAASANVRGAAGPAYGSLTVSDFRADGYNVSRTGSERDGSNAFIVTGKAGVDVLPNLNIEGVVRYTDRRAATDPQDFACTSYFPVCTPANPATYGLAVDGGDYMTYRSLASRLGATLKLLDGNWTQSVNIKGFEEHTRSYSDAYGMFGADGTRVALDYKSTFLFDTSLAGGERHRVTVLADTRRENYVDTSSGTAYLKRRTGIAGEYAVDLATNLSASAAVRHDLNSAFQDVTTWRLAASQRFPSTGTRLHASVGTGVTDPSVFELFGSSFNLPNPSLRPEQSTGWDVGVEQRWLDGMIVTDATYFESRFTDKIELVPGPGGFPYIYVNGAGVAHRQGVELSGTFKPASWLTLTGTYTYTHARNSAGSPEVRRPPHSASFNAMARLPDDKTRLTFGVTYNSVRKDYVFTPTSTVLGDLPSATILRGQISHDLTPMLTAFVRAENIFNVRYEEVYSYRAPGFAIYGGLKFKSAP
jgi:vitamin B12 transporter